MPGDLAPLAVDLGFVDDSVVAVAAFVALCTGAHLLLVPVVDVGTEPGRGC